MNWQGELNKYLASAYKNWIISRRNIFTIFELFFWPMISLLSIGLLTRFLKVDESMVSFLLVGSIALTVLQVAQIDVAYVLLFDMWSKSIKNTFIAPVHSYHLIFGALLFGIVRGSIVFGILIVVSRYLFGFDFQSRRPPAGADISGRSLCHGRSHRHHCLHIHSHLRPEGGCCSLEPERIDPARQRNLLSCGGAAPCPADVCQSHPADLLPGILQVNIYSRPAPFGYGNNSGRVLPHLGLILFDRAIERARRTGILLRLSE